LVIEFFMDKGLECRYQSSGVDHVDDWIYASNN
jgi:hypothetical protein